MKSILDNYNLSEHQFKPAVLKKGTKQFSYNWFRMYGDMTPLLDFKKSMFEFRNNSTNVSTEVKYENMNAFSSAKKQAAITFDRIRNKEPLFNEAFHVANYDMVFLGRLDPIRYIVNETLKTHIENEQLTGIRFEHISYLR